MRCCSYAFTLYFVAMQQELTDIELIIKEMSGKSTSLIAASKYLLNSLEGQIEISVEPILYGPFVKTWFSNSNRVYCWGDRWLEEKIIIATCRPISRQRPKYAHAKIENVLQEVFLCGPRHAHC
jgi:hypothetical protein